MSLMQLLAMGQSLKRPKEGPSEYRYWKNALPKFAPAKRPLELAPARVEAARPMVTGTLFDWPNRLARVEHSSREGTAFPADKAGKPEPAVRSSPPETPAALVSRAKDDPVAVRRELSAVLPGVPARRVRRSFWSWLFRRRVTAGTLVQAEWSLEKVTVVRNDLSDSDLELISAPRRSASVAEAPIAGQAWSRLTARLLKSGGTK